VHISITLIESAIIATITIIITSMFSYYSNSTDYEKLHYY